MNTVICKLGKAAKFTGKCALKPLAWYLKKSAESYEKLMGPEYYKYPFWM